LDRTDITAHGFRSSFRDWAAEQTNYAREVAEAALAHTLSDKVEAAYRRTDLFDKRAKLMEAWARHCATPRASAIVVPIRKPKG
jgi:integrase